MGPFSFLPWGLGIRTLFDSRSRAAACELARSARIPINDQPLSPASSRGSYGQMSARASARAIILSRSLRSAFLLSLSRSAGMDENAVSIAMSFASAKLTFINRNSCSILSSVWSDKSYPKSDSGCDYRHLPLVRQRRSSMYV